MSLFRVTVAGSRFLVKPLISNLKLAQARKVNLPFAFYSTGADKKIDRPKDIFKEKKDTTSKGGPIGWRNLAACGVFFGTVYVFFLYARHEKEQKMRKNRKQMIGKAKIGGGFELLDQDGKLRKSEDFHGQWLFIYFGFTHCPDICPDEMEKMGELVDMLEKEGKTVTPLFITVDPKRDGVKEVAEYVKEFHPKMIGLTGTEEQVKAACKAYRVYYSEGPADEDNDYIVDHTIIIYLINPDGDFVDYFGQTKTAETIKKSVLFTMAKYDAAGKLLGIF